LRHCNCKVLPRSFLLIAVCTLTTLPVSARPRSAPRSNFHLHNYHRVILLSLCAAPFNDVPGISEAKVHLNAKLISGPMRKGGGGCRHLSCVSACISKKCNSSRLLVQHAAGLPRMLYPTSGGNWPDSCSERHARQAQTSFAELHSKATHRLLACRWSCWRWWTLNWSKRFDDLFLFRSYWLCHFGSLTSSLD